MVDVVAPWTALTARHFAKNGEPYEWPPFLPNLLVLNGVPRRRRRFMDGRMRAESSRIPLEKVGRRDMPDVARTWHPTLNGDLTPYKVTVGSAKRAWWQCDFGHVWRTVIAWRTKIKHPSRCPACYQTRRRQATTSKPRRSVHLAKYEGRSHGPVRRMG